MRARRKPPTAATILAEVYQHKFQRHKTSDGSQRRIETEVFGATPFHQEAFDCLDEMLGRP
jgi:hypothetical protein